jgi:DNA-binding response OmpR family regulator
MHEHEVVRSGSIPTSLQVRLVFGQVAELLALLEQGQRDDLSILDDAADILQEGVRQDAVRVGDHNVVTSIRKVLKGGTCAPMTEKEMQRLELLATRLRAIKREAHTAEAAEHLAALILPEVDEIHEKAVRARGSLRRSRGLGLVH